MQRMRLSTKQIMQHYFNYGLRRFMFSRAMEPLTDRLSRWRAARTSQSAKVTQLDLALTGPCAAYLKPTVSVLVRARLALTLCQSFNPGAQAILDVGCGGGQLAKVAREQGFSRYVGADLSPVAVKTASEDLQTSRMMYPSSCRFETGDLGRYTPAEVNGGALFDLIVFNEVLYYIPTPQDAAAIVMRYAAWLSPGGAICVSMKNDGKSRAVMREIAQRFTLVDSLLFQEHLERPRYRVRLDRKRPAFLIGLWQPRSQCIRLLSPMAQAA